MGAQSNTGRRQSSHSDPGSPALLANQRFQSKTKLRSKEAAESCLSPAELGTEHDAGGSGGVSQEAIWSGPGYWSYSLPGGSAASSHKASHGRQKAADDLSQDSTRIDPVLIEKRARADELRDALKAANAALAKADWKEFKDEEGKLIDKAMKDLKHTEQALDKSNFSVKNTTAQLELPSTRRFAIASDRHQESVHNDIERIRSAKARLCETRKTLARDAHHRHKLYSEL